MPQFSAFKSHPSTAAPNFDDAGDDDDFPLASMHDQFAKPDSHDLFPEPDSHHASISERKDGRNPAHMPFTPITPGMAFLDTSTPKISNISSFASPILHDETPLHPPRGPHTPHHDPTDEKGEHKTSSLIPAEELPPITTARVYGKEHARTREVTVFGFPPQKAYVVLNRFRTYGDFRHEEGGGNWVHLRYSDPIKAELALADNGLTIDGEFMIGVKPRERSTTTCSSVLTSQTTSNIMADPPKSRLEADLEMLRKEGGFVGSMVEMVANTLTTLCIISPLSASKTQPGNTKPLGGTHPGNAKVGVRRREGTLRRREGACAKLSHHLLHW